MASENLEIPVDQSWVDGNDEDDAESLTSGRSLASTITNYQYEHGRRYHAYRKGQYYQPNDDKQNEYEAMAHHLWLLTLEDRLFLAPVEDPRRVLDLGTGTGLWAIDVADKFPLAEVIGTDLSPTQSNIVPPNVRFEVDDCSSAWTYPDNHFDLIHMRSLGGGVEDWPTLYRSILTSLRPNGYIEHAEFSVHCKLADPDSSALPPDNVFYRWGQHCVEASVKMGRSMEVSEHMREWIAEAGFTDVVERIFKWPVGPWSSDPKLKELGRWNRLNWEEGMEGWCLALFTRYLNWTYAEVQEYLAAVREAFRERRWAHVYHEVRIVYARKPT